MFGSGNLGDKLPSSFLKIFKNMLGQFIPNPEIILTTPKQSLLLGYFIAVNHFARYGEIYNRN